MYFSVLASYLEKLEKTASRNEMTKILAEVLGKTSEKEIDKACYLMLGELLPSYRGVEFNIAEKIMIQVLASCYGRRPAEVEKLYKSKGDLGDIVSALSAHRRAPGPKHISVNEVYGKLLEVAKDSGEGSQERKIKKLSDLLCALDHLSAKFVARIPVGKLRLGFSDATILDALSFIVRRDKSARPTIEKAFNVTADIGAIAKRIKKSGLSSFKNIEPRPGIPIRPSLAERLPTIEEAVKKAGPRVGVEQKLDGFRTQIHIWQETGRKEIKLFSRNLENTTPMFPEIVESAKKLKLKSAILDGETIGYNPRNGKFAPFQETVQRKRKYEIKEFAKKIPLSIFIFDILYINGRSLLDLSFSERRKILEKTLIGLDQKNSIRLSPQKETGDPGLVEGELKKSIAAGLEGLVVKNLASPYEAGNRGFHWIKLKATLNALETLRGGKKRGERQVLDTIDCLLMGAYKGRGKRAQFGVGGFLLGVRGNNNLYYSISRLGTGLSDEQLREAKIRVEKIKSLATPKEYVVDKEITPDIWVKPSMVVEILADEITLSPRHTTGRRGDDKGYSLRFPRLVRFRDDKSPEDTTTAEEVKNLYSKQKRA